MRLYRYILGLKSLCVYSLPKCSLPLVDYYDTILSIWNTTWFDKSHFINRCSIPLIILSFTSLHSVGIQSVPLSIPNSPPVIDAIVSVSDPNKNAGIFIPREGLLHINQRAKGKCVIFRIAFVVVNMLNIVSCIGKHLIYLNSQKLFSVYHQCWNKKRSVKEIYFRNSRNSEIWIEN